MTTWSCPLCKSVNPSPIIQRPRISCGACNNDFSLDSKSTNPIPILLPKKESLGIFQILGGLGFFGCFIAYATQSGTVALISVGLILTWYVKHEFFE